MTKTTIELKDRTYREDEQGRWTMDDSLCGLTNEPVFFDDMIAAVESEQGKAAARKLDPMRSMRRQ